jgi:hypothetical protein
MINYKLETPLEETRQWRCWAREYLEYLATKGICRYRNRAYLFKQLKDNIVKTYWSCRFGGHTWYVKFIFYDSNGNFNVYLEDHSKKFGWWDKLYRLDFTTEYPVQIVNLQDFLKEYTPTQKVRCKECKNFYDWRRIMQIALHVYKQDVNDYWRATRW